ncbi:uncharacterized protein VTP21DRAFT_5009 [Calcarisporiella thermophila]|uniref:uncharacterized protein n=1 Tax=Calcarisporiella thermophila TaxID=911321 RepID=UPI0037436C29
MASKLSQSSNQNSSQAKPTADEQYGTHIRPTMSTLRKWRKKTPRPINCFMAYRMDKHHEILAKYPGMNNKEISRLVGEMWRVEPEEVKTEYRRRAEESKRLHKLNFPEYQYRPKKKSDVQRTALNSREISNRTLEQPESYTESKRVLHGGIGKRKIERTLLWRKTHEQWVSKRVTGIEEPEVGLKLPIAMRMRGSSSGAEWGRLHNSTVSTTKSGLSTGDVQTDISNLSLRPSYQLCGGANGITSCGSDYIGMIPLPIQITHSLPEFFYSSNSYNEMESRLSHIVDKHRNLPHWLSELQRGVSHSEPPPTLLDFEHQPTATTWTRASTTFNTAHGLYNWDISFPPFNEEFLLDSSPMCHHSYTSFIENFSSELSGEYKEALLETEFFSPEEYQQKQFELSFEGTLG